MNDQWHEEVEQMTSLEFRAFLILLLAMLENGEVDLAIDRIRDILNR